MPPLYVGGWVGGMGMGWSGCGPVSAACVLPCLSVSGCSMGKVCGSGWDGMRGGGAE